MIDVQLQKLITDNINDNLANIGAKDDVYQAMSYAINNGGKRIRPLLLLSLLNDLHIDINKGLNVACAIEMIHTYSLIHDDLPAMDDDDYRRGKLTVHKKFNEAIAILAGDALLTEAFKVSIDPLLTDKQNIKIIKELTHLSGINGMIYGQELDLRYEGQDLNEEQIIDIHNYKTGKMISLPLICAAIIADREELIPNLRDVGSKLGLAFQIQDDVFDVSGSLIQTGKTQGSDLKNNKMTYAILKGEEEAIKTYQELFNDIMMKIKSLNLKDNHLLSLVDFISNRTF